MVGAGEAALVPRENIRKPTTPFSTPTWIGYGSRISTSPIHCRSSDTPTKRRRMSLTLLKIYPSMSVAEADALLTGSSASEPAYREKMARGLRAAELPEGLAKSN